ncbi:NAD-binding protein [Parafrankia colletiae]|uniref:NAD-binding protein n=1 Tax=Parafrankia colletiae TaxID=573497 RepID=A0A1S1R9B4_9ACTN|nr:NAD(P)H-binding protein [Parafrankia colletiae]MCK9905023.1 NAD(P)H-binding protein [Frankia sp. Cpl3]OHV42790.1 NAD-binding protein [Parafrankia colletiae]
MNAVGTNIVVFGAGGRAGRQAVAEARRRGHRVTAVVRDPARHRDLPSDIRVVAGDVTDAVSVERAAAGQDAAVSAAADLSVPAHDFFTASSRALATGLATAGVRRLVVVGLSSVLPGASGAALMDEPGYPNEYRSFSLGHLAGLDELRASELDWAYVAPAGDFDHDGTRTGRYRIAEHGDPASRIGHADFAIALLDEIEEPRHHRATVSVQ